MRVWASLGQLLGMSWVTGTHLLVNSWPCSLITGVFRWQYIREYKEKLHGIKIFFPYQRVFLISRPLISGFHCMCKRVQLCISFSKHGFASKFVFVCASMCMRVCVCESVQAYVCGCVCTILLIYISPSILGHNY